MGFCKTCIHTSVCMKDKNIIGDIYVAPHPLFFDDEYKKKSWENYLKWEKEGFPCSEYMELIRCKDCVHLSGKDGDRYCYLDGRGITDEDYCSKGERREDADE